MSVDLKDPKVLAATIHSPEARAKAAASNRGKKRSAEFCRMTSERQKGKSNLSQEARLRLANTLRGRKQSEESNRKRRETLAGRCTPPPEHFEKLMDLYKGKPFSGKTYDHTGRIQSEEERERRKLTAIRGEEHHNFIDGLSRDRRGGRGKPEYRRWRMACLRRDKRTCQDCGSTKGQMTVHHIKAYATHPDLRYDTSNGITLCVKCHAAADPIFRCARSNQLSLTREEIFQS